MFCPQCGTESSRDLKYCRACGANLKVIGKAVSLSEAIARSDSVPAKIKDMVKNLKIEKVTEEVSRAMDKMNREIIRSASGPAPHKSWLTLEKRKQKTAEERRERHLVKGTIKLFWGGGLTIFLYYLAHALVLKLPPDFVARIPFEVDPVVRVIWLLGLLPMLSGVGHIIAGLAIRPAPVRQVEFPEQSPLKIDPVMDHEIPASVRYHDEIGATSPREAPPSVTDRTTNILERKVPVRQTDEISK